MSPLVAAAVLRRKITGTSPQSRVFDQCLKICGMRAARISFSIRDVAASVHRTKNDLRSRSSRHEFQKLNAI
jgi:hypothetical protein